MSADCGQARWQDGGMAEPAVMCYAPFFSDRGRLITCHTRARLPVLADAAVAHLWQSVLLDVRRDIPFRLHGYVTLPDHVHLLLEAPPESTPELIMRYARGQFEHDYRIMLGLPDSADVWPAQQQIVALPDVATFAAALDYIHYDPVHHGLASRPEEWANSSYRAWIERRVYKLGWGWQRPARVAGRRWG